MEKYRNRSKFYSGVNSLWVIQNSKQVIDTLHKLSNRKSVSAFDFSTLCTNMPYDEVIKTLNYVIDFTFKGRTQNKISLNNYDIAVWCKSSQYFVFDIDSLKNATEYRIRNCYFAIADQIFQQIFVIPMGPDLESFFTFFVLF